MASDDPDTLREPEFHTLTTDRLRLRTLRVADAQAMLPILRRIEVMQWTTVPKPLTSFSQAERWLKDRALGVDVFNFAVELLHGTGEIIGVVGSFHWPQIGYLFSPDYWGRGYATEALNALLPALFEHIPLALDAKPAFDHLEAHIQESNRSSRGVVERCGFTLCEIVDERSSESTQPLRVAVYRRATPGRTLEISDALRAREGARLSPPLQ